MTDMDADIFSTKTDGPPRIRMLMAGCYPPDPGRIAGGPVYNTYMQVETLRERDDIDLVVVSRYRDVLREDLMDLQGVQFRWLKEPRRRLLPRQFSMIGKLTAVMRDIGPDVVVSHNYVETLAALRSGLPTAYIVHGIAKDEQRHMRGVEALKFRLQLRMDLKAIRECGHLVCISDYGVRACAEDSRARIHRISYPLVEDAFFAAAPYAGGKAVLYAGTIYPLKNTLSLLKAIRIVLGKHPDARLRICGRLLDEAYMQSLQQYVRDQGMESSVDFLGVIDRAEIIKCLSDSACLVLPSRQENTPNVVAQAMSAARAVVATPVGGVPEMVDDGITGYLVGPDDIEGMADRIIRLMDNPELGKTMGLAAREKALRSFERHAHIDQLVSICRDVISDSERSP